MSSWLDSPFAWLKAIQAAEKGDYSLLDARLDDGRFHLTMEERQLIRRNGFKAPRRTREPKPRYHVTETNESLEVARLVIRESKGYRRGLIKRARDKAMEKFKCRETTIKNHIAIAQRFRGGEWWSVRCRLERKGKGQKPF